jgi:hypothetical protein
LEFKEFVMTGDIDLKRIERSAWESYFQDGLWDIFMGLLMLGMGIEIISGETVWYMIVVALAVLVPIIGKRFITNPRLGRVKFGRSRRLKQKKVIAVLGLSSLVGVAIFFLTVSGVEIPRAGMAAIAGVWFLIVFSLMGYFMDFLRMYPYGLAFSLCFSLALGLRNDLVPSIAFLVSGSIVMLVGVAILSHFIRNNPRLQMMD